MKPKFTLCQAEALPSALTSHSATPLTRTALADPGPLQAADGPQLRVQPQMVFPTSYSLASDMQA